MSMVNNILHARSSCLCEFVILCEVHKKYTKWRVEIWSSVRIISEYQQQTVNTLTLKLNGDNTKGVISCGMRRTDTVYFETVLSRWYWNSSNRVVGKGVDAAAQVAELKRRQN